MVEAGFPTLDVGVNFYILTAAASPKTAVQRLNEAFGKALATKEVKDKLASQGVDAKGTTPEEAATILRDEIARWGKVVKASGVKMQ
jgi:tripartite-type tricarboxylate transporter receptor subunit TctC